jgi:hypothetical protein
MKVMNEMNAMTESGWMGNGEVWKTKGRTRNRREPDTGKGTQVMERAHTARDTHTHTHRHIQNRRNLLSSLSFSFSYYPLLRVWMHSGAGKA